MHRDRVPMQRGRITTLAVPEFIVQCPSTARTHNFGSIALLTGNAVFRSTPIHIEFRQEIPRFEDSKGHLSRCLDRTSLPRPCNKPIQ